MAKSSLIVITTRQTLKDRLKKDLGEEFELNILKSGQEALKFIQDKIPDAVVMDHSLEDFLTYRFIDKVRNNPVTRNLPFILVSRESGHSYVEQAVRSGVSHYIGVPYETRTLIEKIKTALMPGQYFSREKYFSLPASIDTDVVSYGRISFISSEGIHFETHLKLEGGQKLSIASPLSDALSQPWLEVEVNQIGSDVFYNYPFAVDARWVDPAMAKKVQSWIFANRRLNSPKKSKILFVGFDLTAEEELAESFDKNQFSLRFSNTLEAATQSLPFLKPTCVVVRSLCWINEPAFHDALFRRHEGPWIISGDDEIQIPEGRSKPLIVPFLKGTIESALRTIFPPKPEDPDKLYFSKTLEDSRLKIFLKGKVLQLGEMGVRLAIDREVIPPCNFEISLKTFTSQDVRNPFVRVWPPAQKLTLKESEGGKWKITMESHFLGINDLQAQSIRAWLRDEELKEKRQKIADITPKPKPPANEKAPPDGVKKPENKPKP